MTRARVAVLALAAAACGPSGLDAPAATAWLQDVGRRAPTWEPCLRMGTELRSACRGDASCERGATRNFTYFCYEGRYRGPDTGHSPMSLSPCFWENVNRHGDRMLDPGEPGYVSLDQWAVATCARLVLDAKPCVAELHDIVGMCNVELTGAGP